MDWSIIKFGAYRTTCIIYTNTIDYYFNAILEKKLLLEYSRTK